MRRLNTAATTYSATMVAIAASGGVSMPVSNQRQVEAEQPRRDAWSPTNWPPSSTPRMIDMMVRPSIQPLALTSCDGGNSSVRMPYLAGE